MPRPAKPGHGAGRPARRVHLHLRPGAQAPGEAREMVAQACHEWALPHLSDDAQLIVSELVTNGILHARSELRVTAALGATHLHLYVRDRGRGVPHVPSYRTRERRSIGGLGLILVDSLAAAWGTTIGAHGKTVWATLPVPRTATQ